MTCRKSLFDAAHERGNIFDELSRIGIVIESIHPISKPVVSP